MKIGDKVICIDNKPTPLLLASGTYLTIGNEYTITDTDGGGVWAVNDGGFEQRYLRNRFMYLSDIEKIVQKYK